MSPIRRGWPRVCVAVVALAIAGCGALRDDGAAGRTDRGATTFDERSVDDTPPPEVELPAAGSDHARSLVEQRSGLELPEDVEVEVLALYPQSDGVAARFEAATADAEALCEHIGGWLTLAAFSDEQHEWTGVSDEPVFRRVCRASDPALLRRQLELIHVADEDEPAVVTVHLLAWLMPVR